jgi:hypothetical protein
MRVPWSQIVQLMPSILEVSRELLKRTRAAGEPEAALPSLPATAELEARVSILEDTEQRQAELSTNMADQLAQLTAAVTDLHRRVRWLLIGVIATAVLALVAVALAVRASS